MIRLSKNIFAAFLFIVSAFTASACGFSGDNNNSSSEIRTSSIDKTGKKVYFAGPMFNQSEKDYNLKITHILEEYNYEVFLPQRDGVEGATLEGKTEQELIDIIFPLDVTQISESDILFMNLDGRVPDEGACVELGMAYAQGKRCYGFMTDTRTVESSMTLNPMISGCMIKIFHDYDGEKMIQSIKDYLDNNTL